MARWFLAALYCPLIPLTLAGALPDLTMARIVGLATLLAGLVVARLHLRQSSGKGQLAILVGYLLAMLVAVGLWFMGLLSLAFLSDSGKHQEQITFAMWAFTGGLALLMPILGGWLGSLVVRPSASS